MTDYQPIDCGLYGQYESAVVHRTPLTLCWRGADGMSHLETLLPEDLVTRNGEEFLVVRDRSGKQFRVRLDHISGMHSRATELSA